MNKLNYEILSAIDDIDSTIMESELSVMNSLIGSYEKAAMILENCNDIDDTSAFDIFQEGFFVEADENTDDENSTNGEVVKSKKSIKEIIINILLFIPRMIKKAYNFIKRKISKMNKPVSEAVVNKAKSSVDDDVITIKTEISPDTSKPEVTVSTTSNDTEKEEQIKSKVESSISSIPTHMSSHTKGSSPIVSGGVSGNSSGTVASSNVSPFKSGVSGNSSGTVASSNVSPFKSGVSGNSSGVQALSDAIPQNQQSTNTTVKISKDDIEVSYLNCSKHANELSSLCKKIGELFTTIDIERMGEPKYNQEFALKLNTLIKMNFFDITKPEYCKSKYSEFVVYTNNVKASLNTSMNLLKNCSDTLEKSITIYKNKNKMVKIPENNIKGEAKDIIDSIKMMKKFTCDFVIDAISTDIELVDDTVISVNRYIETVLTL